ncbi:AcvB/VirJ family lysyl-phosphatidylglycerol hydrolase [Methylopila musalis]|uniref:AcvB/VirJ family lysyl-phosphatidylglycerol hydrolase n=1 Tax=Methylopila musalis TaxID=1134781 RepID=A0ABW3Z892_9HYPH
MTYRRALLAFVATFAVVAYPAAHKTLTHWLPGLRQAHLPPGETLPELADLPVVAVAPKGPPRALAVIVTGGGGWATIDRKLAKGFAEDGVATIGLDSLRYFLTPRSPDEVGADVGRIIETARRLWNVRDVALVGYSFGADTAPVAYNRLPAEDRALVRSVAMLGLSNTADLAMGVAKIAARFEGYPKPTVPEVIEASAAPERPTLICVYGAGEQAEGRTPCPGFDPARVTLIETPGGHHFDGDYDRIARAISATLKPRA